jgi:hypothetical protein
MAPRKRNSARRSATAPGMLGFRQGARAPDDVRVGVTPRTLQATCQPGKSQRRDTMRAMPKPAPFRRGQLVLVPHWSELKPENARNPEHDAALRRFRARSVRTAALGRL